MTTQATEDPFDDQPRRRSGLVTIPVGAEAVVLDGWEVASALNASANQIWRRFDGVTTLGAIADQLAGALHVDRELIASDVIHLAQQLGHLGLLEGIQVRPADGAPSIALEPVHIVADVGETIGAFELTDMDGRTLMEGRTLRASKVDVEASLLVNWSPHCGYCASIVDVLAELDGPLRAAGVELVLYAYGSAEASETQARLSGWHPRVVLKPPHEMGPFLGHGTPAAFHLDEEGTLLSPAACGTDAVVQLAAELAGTVIDYGDLASGAARSVLAPGGSCGPGTGSEPISRWAGTRVYRIGDFHIGLRYGTDSTACLLDELFLHDVVDDRRAGHVFTVSLPSLDAASDGSAAAVEADLLALGSSVLVRSRSSERVLRSLLWRLGDLIGEEDHSPGLVRVTATAIVAPTGAALVQPGIYALEEDLQPALARHGIAFVDVAHPLIDLHAAELVVPEPSIAHDARALVARSPGRVVGWDEPEPVRPGRYPLIGWGVAHPAGQAVTRFTPAEAAAATLSLVLATDDGPRRVRELGELFQRIDGFGLWYHSEAELADAIALALGLGAE